MTAQASAPKLSKRFSSASTPTGRTTASARTPGLGSRFPSKSSRPIAAGCGLRTAPLSRRPEAASRACWAPASRCACRRCDGAATPTEPPSETRIRRGMNQSPSIHASAVLVGARAVLIQGPSGSGKSRLALALLHAAAQGLVPFARLVADDRAHVEARHGRLLVRPAEALAGLIEIRGLGIRRVPHEPLAVVGLLVELGQAAAERLPDPAGKQAGIAGIILPRLAVAAGADFLPLLLAELQITVSPG